MTPDRIGALLELMWGVRLLSWNREGDYALSEDGRAAAGLEEPLEFGPRLRAATFFFGCSVRSRLGLISLGADCALSSVSYERPVL